MINAKVFPDPVTACVMQSLNVNIKGMTAFWTGVGEMNDERVKAFKTDSLKFSDSNEVLSAIFFIIFYNFFLKKVTTGCGVCAIIYYGLIPSLLRLYGIMNAYNYLCLIENGHECQQFILMSKIWIISS